MMTEFTDLSVLKELFNTRLDALEAKLASMMLAIDKEDMRQDEAIERLADRTTHNSETSRLTERVRKLEDQRERDKGRIDSNEYKVRVSWTIGTVIFGLFISVLAAMIKGWIGV
jgi:hypothetical protein